MEEGLIDSVTKQKIKESACFLYFSALTADLLTICYGINLGWTSPVIPQLQSNDTNVNPLGIPITSLQISIMTSIPILAKMLTTLLWAKVIDQIGRMVTMRMLAMLLLISLVTTAFATSIYVYYVSLFITGMSLCGAVVSLTVYNSEIAEDCNRYKLGCLMGLHVPIGLLFSYVFGPLTDVMGFTLLCAVPVVLFLVLSSFLTESPTYLISKKRVTEARKALEKLRNTKNVKYIQNEYEHIQNIMEATTKANRCSYSDIFRTRSTRRAFLIGTEAFAVQQLSGILVILAYVAPIFNQAGAGLSGNNVGVVVGAIMVVMYFVSTCLVGKFGRRPLMLTSALAAVIPMFLLGVYFYLKHVGSFLTDEVRWISVICVIVFIVVYSIGLGPIPMGFIGELFPEDLRAVGVSSIYVMGELLMCVITFGFPILAEAFGLHTCFWICSINGLIGFSILYITMPETKGKTFLEIQVCLSK